MSIANKRIETVLPSDSYSIVADAAQRSGMTIKSFAAMALMTTAIEMLKNISTCQTQDYVHNLKLSKAEAKELETLLEHPEVFSEALEKARLATQAIPEKAIRDEARF